MNYHTVFKYSAGVILAFNILLITIAVIAAVSVERDRAQCRINLMIHGTPGATIKKGTFVKMFTGDTYRMLDDGKIGEEGNTIVKAIKVK